MGSAGINPNWEADTSITSLGRGDQEDANFIYKVEPPFSEIEYRALLSTGLMLHVTVDGEEIDPNGESIVKPIAMDDYEGDEPVSSSVKVSGKSEPIKRVRDLERIAGALKVMRNGAVEITFDEAAQQLL